MWSPDESPDVVDVADAPALWRLLVNRGFGFERPRADAIEMFERLHDSRQPGAYDSALLLCTDWCWRRTSSHVLADIVATGILDDEDLDRLTDQFLWSDKISYEHPTGWIGSSFLEFDIGPKGRLGRSRTVHVNPKTPMTTDRHVWPPLRRWAAERILRRSRAAVPAVLHRAEELAPQHGAAVATGAVSAAGALDVDEARVVIDCALRRGQKPPRMAALLWLAETGEADHAVALAADDPDASIRAWGRKLHTNLATEAQTSLFD